LDVLKQSELLQDIPLFSTLTPPQLKLLAFTCEVFEYETGEYLFKQGEATDAIYVILQGEVEILEMTGESPLVLATKSTGDLFGEMAVLTGEPRSASVRTISKVEALKLPNERFLELITTNEGFTLFVLKDLATKLADTNRKLMRSAKTQAQPDSTS